MKQFMVIPKIVELSSVKEFIEAYQITNKDILFINDFMYQAYFKKMLPDITVIDFYKYGHGEPTDIAVEAMAKAIDGMDYDRVIAVGGGTIIDTAKLFALKTITPVVDLFEGKIPVEKAHKLILIPTTCGTGSEVTNISILELTTRGTKFGLAKPELYADDAVLIPEFLEGLPYGVFVTSSIDALIHSIESFTSPKANSFTRMYSKEAMRMILEGYKAIAIEGKAAIKPRMRDFLLASNYAGIAFGNAGCAAVHAMSYPLGAKYHVAHGESNYAMFTGVYKKYMELNPNGGIQLLNYYLSSILGCTMDLVYDKLEELLNHLLKKKPLHEYGVKEEELIEFTDSVMAKQGRLMANNYTELSRDTVLEIYKRLY